MVPIERPCNYLTYRFPAPCVWMRCECMTFTQAWLMFMSHERITAPGIPYCIIMLCLRTYCMVNYFMYVESKWLSLSLCSHVHLATTTLLWTMLGLAGQSTIAACLKQPLSGRTLAAVAFAHASAYQVIVTCFVQRSFVSICKPFK